MTVAEILAAVLPPTIGMAAFAVACMLLMRRADRAEVDRDRLWDELHGQPGEAQEGSQ